MGKYKMIENKTDRTLNSRGNDKMRSVGKYKTIENKTDGTLNSRDNDLLVSFLRLVFQMFTYAPVIKVNT